MGLSPFSIRIEFQLTLAMTRDLKFYLMTHIVPPFSRRVVTHEIVPLCTCCPGQLAVAKMILHAIVVSMLSLEKALHKRDMKVLEMHSLVFLELPFISLFAQFLAGIMSS